MPEMPLRMVRKTPVKPPYLVPTMTEIKALPWNGLTVASTFSGGGGSCTGYRMAGYKVLWANEFVPAAQATYRANHPETHLDTRSIRDLSAADVLAACEMNVGDLDLLDGSPPCQAFSLQGKRQRGWGVTNQHVDGSVQKASDDLFFEYARLVKGLQPRIFVAENVEGLTRGKAVGYFKWIMRELRACGYNVAAKILDAAWLGVPQSRKRVIFIGVRDDLNMRPEFPKPFSYQYTMRDALPHLNEKSRMTRQYGRRQQLVPVSLDRPSPTVLAHGIAGVWPTEALLHLTDPDTYIDPETRYSLVAGEWETTRHEDPKPRTFTLAELRALCSFPPDYVLTGNYRERWARLGNAVPPLMIKAIAETLAHSLSGGDVYSP